MLILEHKRLSKTRHQQCLNSYVIFCHHSVWRQSETAKQSFFSRFYATRESSGALSQTLLSPVPLVIFTLVPDLLRANTFEFRPADSR